MTALLSMGWLLVCLAVPAAGEAPEAAPAVKSVRLGSVEAMGCAKDEAAEKLLTAELAKQLAAQPKIKLLGETVVDKQQVDFLLGLRLMCTPNGDELNLSLTEVESAEIAWARSLSLDGLADLPLGLGAGLRHMAGFLDQGLVEQPPELPGNSLAGRGLLMGFVKDSSGKLGPAAAKASSRKARWALLRISGADVMPLAAAGGCATSECLVLRAEEDAADLALFMELVKKDKGCSLELLLTEIHNFDVRARFSAPMACTAKDLDAKLEEALCGLTRKAL